MNQHNREENISNFLRDSLQDYLPGRLLADPQKLAGGSINRAYKLVTEKGPYFLKLNHSRRFPGMFEKEQAGLSMLANSKSFVVPAVIGLIDHPVWSGIICEYLEEAPPAKHSYETFAVALAQLHHNTHRAFGLDHHNYIESLLQHNDYRENWVDFFRECRLMPLWEKARSENYFGREDEISFEGLCSRLSDLLPVESPALLHGDLWSGNYFYTDTSAPAIFDPAVYYGLREMDLAMMKLFGGFDSRIFEVYEEIFPLPPGGEERVELHNLYPLLVHLNLFGASYLPAVRSAVRKFGN